MSKACYYFKITCIDMQTATRYQLNNFCQCSSVYPSLTNSHIYPFNFLEGLLCQRRSSGSSFPLKVLFRCSPLCLFSHMSTAKSEAWPLFDSLFFRTRPCTYWFLTSLSFQRVSVCLAFTFYWFGKSPHKRFHILHSPSCWQMRLHRKKFSALSMV